MYNFFKKSFNQYFKTKKPIKEIFFLKYGGVYRVSANGIFLKLNKV